MLVKGNRLLEKLGFQYNKIEKELRNNMNYGLLIDKYINKVETNKDENDNKIRFIQIKPEAVFKNKELYKNIDLIKEYYQSNSNYSYSSLELKFDTKLIVGLGNTSTNEFDITMDHTYGIPYIPGQAIKGICRNYFLQTKLGNIENKSMKDIEDLACKNPNFKYLFGYSTEEENQKGNVIFLDAYPVRNEDIIITEDIMTPHYKEYYEGKEAPADYLSPVPISFLTIKEGAKFKFRFALKAYEEKYLDEFFNILTGVFSDIGIGGKTSLGYGYIERNKVRELVETEKRRIKEKQFQKKQN